MFNKKIIGIIICSSIFLITMSFLEEDDFFNKDRCYIDNCVVWHFLPPYSETEYLQDLKNKQKAESDNKRSRILNNMEPRPLLNSYDDFRFVWILSILGIVLGGLSLMTCMLAKKGKYVNYKK